MRRNVLLPSLFLSIATVIFHAGPGEALTQTRLWPNMCESCHNGTTAPDADWMRKKYRSVDQFVTATQAKGDRCMNILKNDPNLIKKIAEELGIGNQPPE